jgi:hypothetical protein
MTADLSGESTAAVGPQLTATGHQAHQQALQGSRQAGRSANYRSLEYFK